jgi:hypothetical protein
MAPRSHRRSAASPPDRPTVALLTAAQSAPHDERDGDVNTAAFLAHAAAVVREHGYVPASSQDPQPTWREALHRLKRNVDLAPDDVHRANQLLGWAASLRPRDPDGYRARIAGCLARDRVSTHELPLLASAIRAFNLHLYYEIRDRKHREHAEDR